MRGGIFAKLAKRRRNRILARKKRRRERILRRQKRRAERRRLRQIRRHERKLRRIKRRKRIAKAFRKFGSEIESATKRVYGDISGNIKTLTGATAQAVTSTSKGIQSISQGIGKNIPIILGAGGLIAILLLKK